jgi:hypothetical protein
MTYYLIDFENVHAAAIANPALCVEGDVVCIYYGASSQDLPLETIHTFFQKRVGLETMPVNTGTKNALDFQLATHLGWLIGSGEHSGASYRIVSNDTGFDCVVAYWKEKGMDIARIPDLSGKTRRRRNAKAKSQPKKTDAQSPKTSRNTNSTTKAEDKS